MKSSFYRALETKEALVNFIATADILSMGIQCRKFEQHFAAKQQRKYAVFVSSGSAANLVLIQALLNLGHLRRGDRVGFSALTWSTNVMPLIQLGLVPVAIDCELETLNISPKTLNPILASLRALFITNALGFCDNLENIESMCRENGVILLEDNCESLGSRAFGCMLGNFGIAATFSFFVGHHLSTIEGGMICTDDEKLFNMLVMVRAHGWDRDLPAEEKIKLRTENFIDNFYSKYIFYELAYNARPTEINGFLGNQQLEYWDEIVSIREKNCKELLQVSSQNSDILPLKLGHMETISNFAIPLIFKDQQIAQKYRKLFMEAEVEIRPVIAGDMTQQPFYKKYTKHQEACPNARLVHSCGFYFPNNPELTEKEKRLLCDLLLKN